MQKMDTEEATEAATEAATEEATEEATEVETEIPEELTEEVTEEVNEAGQTAENMQDAASSEAAEIGEEAALGIALEDAGLSESDVNVVRCGLDYDDGRTEYEIEFYKDRTEYDYTLDAFTGEILEKTYHFIVTCHSSVFLNART